MDVKTEIIEKFAESLSATGSCTPDFIKRLCELIKAGDGLSEERVLSLVEEELRDQH